MGSGPPSPDGSDHRPGDRQTSDNLLQYAGLGLEFAAGIGLFVALGLWLDRRWGSSPVLLLTGLAVGFTAAMYRLIRVLHRRQDDRE